MATNYPINPRVRALGKARLDFARRTKNQIDWEKRWISPSNPFPFDWGDSWKQCVEYRVDDFPAEVGFYIDVLGFSVNALDHAYAMFTSPQADFFISIVPAPHNEQPTPPDAIRIQFIVKDIILTTQALQQRGIYFDYSPQPLHTGSTMFISSFRTPHGVSIELWGRQDALPAVQLELVTKNAINPEDGDEDEGDDDDYEEEDEIGEDSGSVGNDSGDEEESDKGDGKGVLAGEDDERDDEENLGSDEEIDEEDLPVPDKEEDDDDEDELWEKKEFDEDEYGSDWDEDDDDDDDDDGDDEDLKGLNSPALQNVTSFSPTMLEQVKPALPSMHS